MYSFYGVDIYLFKKKKSSVRHRQLVQKRRRQAGAYNMGNIIGQTGPHLLRLS